MDHASPPEGFVDADRFAVPLERAHLDGATYFLPQYAMHRPAVRRVQAGELHEPSTHRLVAEIMARRPGSIVHAGAFFGDMLPSFSAACPSTVFAFEPVLENYVLADLCVQENHLSNVLMFRAALDERIGSTHMLTYDEGDRHRGGTSMVASAGQQVPGMTVDSLSIDDLSVMVLDAEGYERRILVGAQETIVRERPVILIEDNSGDCPPLLTLLGYGPCGRIRGLSVWAFPEDATWLAAVVAQVTG